MPLFPPRFRFNETDHLPTLLTFLFCEYHENRDLHKYSWKYCFIYSFQKHFPQEIWWQTVKTGKTIGEFMTYKMNSSEEFCFKMPRVISQLYAAHITIYYLAFGWNSSLLTTLGKSCYIFHKIWVLDLFLKTLLNERTHCYWLHPSCHKLP